MMTGNYVHLRHQGRGVVITDFRTLGFLAPEALLSLVVDRVG